MKAGKTISELALTLEQQLPLKRDFVVDTRRLELVPKEHGVLLDLQTNDDVCEELGMTDLAHRQLGETLNIPTKYYGRMLTEAPNLLAENANYWFAHQPSVRMVRTLAGNARAFVSRKYNRMDNYDVARAVLPIFQDMPGVRFESCELTENRMYMKAVNPRLQADVRVGDTVQAGVLISNSEVGLGTVTVVPLIYRLVCTNGMVVNDGGVKRRHVGRALEIDSNYSLFSDATKKAEDTAFLMKIRDIVKVAADEARFHAVVERMKQAADATMTTRNVPKVVELAAKHFFITEDETKGVMGHLLNDGNDYSLYGLANAITAQAQEIESYDRSTDLEKTGYEVMTMAPSLWKQINNMAENA